jgi:hypothetical protein
MTQLNLLLIAMFATGVAGQPQMCKEYLGVVPCKDAGCRWVDAWQSPAQGTCTRQCHEFGGAVTGGTDASKAECVSDAVGCRWIVHPENAQLGKCGKMCGEFNHEWNCQNAGYGSCRWAHEDITGGEPECTKMCNVINEKAWCEKVHCIWLPGEGRCRRKCIEFQMKAPCEAIGCQWVTTADGYALSQCIPPAAPAVAPTVAPAATFVNQTNNYSMMKFNQTDMFSAEGKMFKRPVSAKAKQFLMQLDQKH